MMSGVTWSIAKEQTSFYFFFSKPRNNDTEKKDFKLLNLLCVSSLAQSDSSEELCWNWTYWYKIIVVGCSLHWQIGLPNKLVNHHVMVGIILAFWNIMD